MYETPNFSELRAFMDAHNLTGASVGKIVGVDSRAVRRWTAPPEQAGHRDIPWAAWVLLRIYVGEWSLEGYREEVSGV